MSSARARFNLIRLLMQGTSRTRDGRAVRLTRWEVWDDSPIHGIIDGEDKERFWIANGRCSAKPENESPLDIITFED